MEQWETFQSLIVIVGFVSVLIGIWAALMKPAHENNKETQKALQQLGVQMSTLNANLCNLIANDGRQDVRLDRHKDQLYNHEGRLTRIEGVDYIKNRVEDDRKR